MTQSKEILVVGASGATGSLLVAELLNRGHRVKTIVRSPDCFSEVIRRDAGLSLIHASVLSLNDSELAKHVE